MKCAEDACEVKVVGEKTEEKSVESEENEKCE